VKRKADIRVIDCEPLGKDVIDTLEYVLEKARTGKISSVAVAVVYRDGSTSNTWSAAPSASTLVGAVTRLQGRLLRTYDE